MLQITVTPRPEFESNDWLIYLNDPAMVEGIILACEAKATLMVENRDGFFQATFENAQGDGFIEIGICSTTQRLTIGMPFRFDDLDYTQPDEDPLQWIEVLALLKRIMK